MSAQAQTDEFDEFFQGGGGGDFAPTLKFTKKKGPGQKTEVGGGVVGKILSITKQDQKEYTTGKEIPLPKKPDQNKKEIKIILQTELRDWDKVATVPQDDEKNDLPASEDDGRRAIYVRGWMTGAIGDAVKAATGQVGSPKVGGTLGVKVSELVESGKGNPYPKYEAKYTAPDPAEGFFEEGQAASEAKASEATASDEGSASDEDEDKPPF